MEHFDLVVFGGGKGGKTLAMDQARSGRRVALIERRYLGGSCINVACIPSKTLIASSHAVRGDPQAALSRTGRVVSEMVAYNKKLFDASGLTLVWGRGAFVEPRVIAVETDTGVRHVTGDRVYLNLGTTAAIPSYPGLSEARPATHIEALSWTTVPPRLVVLGGGYVAVELAQAFRRLGSEVVLLARGEALLSREDADVAQALAQALRDDGVDVRLNAHVARVEGRSGESVSVSLSDGVLVSGTHLLVATGRVSATRDIGLDIAGVKLDEHGFVLVNERLETSAPGIWALGETAGSPQFTHASLDDFRVAKSGIVGGSRTTTGRLVPSVVFTDPELARVGLTEREAQSKGVSYRLATLDVALVPRAWTLGQRRGLMKALVGDDDTILGFTMLGPQAGEVMTAVHVAMLGNLPFTALRDAVLAHPTMAEGLNMLMALVPAR